MSDVEKSQAQNQKSIIDASLSTDEERKQARLNLDALMWKGIVGPVMERISKLTMRLDKIDGGNLDVITSGLLACQSGWKEHETILAEEKLKRQLLAEKVEAFEQRTNEKFREVNLRVEESIEALRVETNLVIIDLLNEAKTTIMEGAETAAIEAVGRMLGESNDTRV